MSLLNSILSDTAGVAFRAWTGKVDPWTLAEQKAQTNADIAQAGQNLPPDVVKAQQDAAARDIDANLIEENEHPSQVEGIGLHIPGLGDVGSPDFLARIEKIVYALIAVGAIGAAFYFVRQYRKFLK